jgi:hypothetical protein
MSFRKTMDRLFGRSPVPLQPRHTQSFKLPDLPKRQEDIGDYREHLAHAAAFTRHCGFEAPELACLVGDVLTPDGSFAREAAQASGVFDFSGSAGQCLKWCHYLQPYFEQVLGVPVWVTIGQLWAYGKSVFHPDWDDLQRWSRSGIDPVELAMQGRDGINLHAWLTVASGEIIELSLLSSLARVRPSDRELSGAITWGHEDGGIEHHRYLPMTVGSAIAEAIGGNPAFPLLARSKEDLATMPAVGVLYPVD